MTNATGKRCRLIRTADCGLEAVPLSRLALAITTLLLSVSPVRSGTRPNIVMANGRLFVSMTDGTLTCYSGK